MLQKFTAERITTVVRGTSARASGSARTRSLLDGCSCRLACVCPHELLQCLRCMHRTCCALFTPSAATRTPAGNNPTRQQPCSEGRGQGHLVEVLRLVRTADSVPRELSQAEGHARAAAHVSLVLLHGQDTQGHDASVTPIAGRVLYCRGAQSLSKGVSPQDAARETKHLVALPKIHDKSAGETVMLRTEHPACRFSL